MLGIQNIGTYIPKDFVDNFQQADRFETNREFVEQKIGVSTLPRLGKDETVVSACLNAFQNLSSKEAIDLEQIDCVVLCTQNPDNGGLPHNSALLHGELGLSEDCACFDIGLACSGYVYGLSVIQSFMAANGLKKGLFFTCDPYSRILNQDDKNTCLLFGDAASVTLISETPRYVLERAKFSTKGAGSQALRRKNNMLEMNGRAVFNFALQDVPKQINRLLDDSGLTTDDIDLFLLHQGSRYMLESTIKRAGIPLEKAPVKLDKTGNTVSSSIPLLLVNELENKHRTILMSGFGVGLSWATAVYRLVE